jgi:uncharacterized membrane protein YkoI
MAMRKTIVTFVTLVSFAAVLSAAEKPKITMEQARAIALKKAPGKVKTEELEKEHGKLIYSFDIATETKSKSITEVNVDALNGKIVAVQHENAAKEAAEQKQEAKEKAAKH